MIRELPPSLSSSSRKILLSVTFCFRNFEKKRRPRGEREREGNRERERRERERGERAREGRKSHFLEEEAKKTGSHVLFLFPRVSRHEAPVLARVRPPARLNFGVVLAVFFGVTALVGAGTWSQTAGESTER